jgi:hypothetical protein
VNNKRRRGGKEEEVKRLRAAVEFAVDQEERYCSYPSCWLVFCFQKGAL